MMQLFTVAQLPWVLLSLSLVYQACDSVCPRVRAVAAETGKRAHVASRGDDAGLHSGANLRWKSFLRQ